MNSSIIGIYFTDLVAEILPKSIKKKKKKKSNWYVHKSSFSKSLYGPRNAKTSRRAFADGEGPDQPAHPRSLIRALAIREQNHWILQNI